MDIAFGRASVVAKLLRLSVLYTGGPWKPDSVIYASVLRETPKLDLDRAVFIVKNHASSMSRGRCGLSRVRGMDDLDHQRRFQTCVAPLSVLCRALECVLSGCRDLLFGTSCHLRDQVFAILRKEPWARDNCAFGLLTDIIVQEVATQEKPELPSVARTLSGHVRCTRSNSFASHVHGTALEYASLVTAEVWASLVDATRFLKQGWVSAPPKSGMAEVFDSLRESLTFVVQEVSDLHTHVSELVEYGVWPWLWPVHSHGEDLVKILLSVAKSKTHEVAGLSCSQASLKQCLDSCLGYCCDATVEEAVEFWEIALDAPERSAHDALKSRKRDRPPTRRARTKNCRRKVGGTIFSSVSSASSAFHSMSSSDAD
jgi:hypothetical protein